MTESDTVIKTWRQSKHILDSCRFLERSFSCFHLTILPLGRPAGAKFLRSGRIYLDFVRATARANDVDGTVVIFGEGVLLMSGPIGTLARRGGTD